MAERGVRFIQLCHRDWDHHGGLPSGLKTKCQETDRASAALIIDLKQRGLLDETLVIWGGEFWAAYSQGEIKPDNFGQRSSSPLHDLDGRRGSETRLRLLAKPTTSDTTSCATRSTCTTYTPLFSICSASITKSSIYRHEGRDYRLTDIAGNVVKELLA